jgi:electron transfer flavoprotein alpha subunit
MTPSRGDVFVVVEQDRGELRDVTLEMLGDARMLADRLSAKVWALVLGAGWASMPDWVESALPAHGADGVLLLEHELLEPYVTEAHVQAIVDACGRSSPAILMLAASRNGQDLAPRLAARLRVPFASGCISFRLTSEGIFTATRPVCAGKAQETLALQGAQLYVVTLRPGVAGVGRPVAGRRAEIRRMVPELDPAKMPVRVTAFMPADPSTIDLSEAEVVVAGGRGVGGAEGWRRIEELADALGAALGASRVAVDRGWAPFERLVGQTGKTVHAKLYVACGISGASQHVQGMKDSEVIVAINTDKGAPILKLAHLGVVGDLSRVIPALIDRVVALRSTGTS